MLADKQKMWYNTAMILNWSKKIKTRWQGLTPRQKNGVVFLVCLLILGGLWWLGSAQSALAVEPNTGPDSVKDAINAPSTDVKSGIMSFFSTILMGIATLFMKLAIFFLKFLMEVAAYNNYLDSTAVTVGWVMVRDITNMFFVVILLLIAFGTILGIEQYEWKKLLVKFVFAAILVNFSRVICALIIDAAQVIMMTFLNGVGATASGNLLSAFNLKDVLAFGNVSASELGNTEVILASMAAVWFTAMTAAVIAGYAMMMVVRLVMLWILIVLSPLAFLFSVLPQTQSYGSQWWKEFTNNVVVGPVLAFFLWLSFVTVGAGNIHDEIAKDNSFALTEEIAIQGATGIEQAMMSPGAQTSAGISKAMAWTKMAGLFIAIGMLFAGIKVTLQFSPEGAGLLSKAVDYGKRAAMLGSGVAAGFWLKDKGIELGKKGIKAAAWHAPLIGGEKWANLGKTMWENVKSSYYRKGAGLTERGMTVQGKKADEMARIEALRAQQEMAQTPEEKERIGKQIEEKEANIEKLENEIISEHQSGGVIGWFARRGISSEKHLEKSKKQADTLKKLVWKRTGAEAGGVLFNRQFESINAQDRVERGMLAAEEARSKAKDEEFEGKGKMATLATARQKFTKGGFSDWEKQAKKGTEQDQIAEHKRGAVNADNILKTIEAASQTKIDKNVQQKLERANAEVKRIEASGVSDDIKKTQIANIENELRNIPSVGSRFSAKQLEAAEGRADIAAGLAEGEFVKGSVWGSTLAGVVADTGIGVKIGEEFVNEVKNAHLTGQFKKAAERMKEIMANGLDEDKLRVMAAPGSTENLYTKVLAQAELAKLTATSSDLQRRTAVDAANDAFVQMPRYGTTTPSTVLSDYAKAEEAELSKMQRIEAMIKTTEVMAHLLVQKNKKPGGLDIDQLAKFNAYTSTLSKEAWIDDQHSNIKDYFEQGMKGKTYNQLDEKQKAMTDYFTELGWAGQRSDGTVEFKARHYEPNGRQARDLIIGAATGGDVGLIKAHHAIEKELDLVDTKVAEVVEKAFNQRLEQLGADVKYQESYNTAKKIATEAATSQGLAAGPGRDNFIKNNIRALFMEELKNEDKKLVEEVAKKAAESVPRKDYWQAADDVLRRGAIHGMSSGEDMRKQYGKYSDFLQQTTRQNVDYALATGHPELAYHTNKDEKYDVFRFQTLKEAGAQIHADRVKINPKQLVAKEQYHGQMTVDQDNFVGDDFHIPMLNNVLARIEKAYDATLAVDRTIKGWVYLHKSEDMRTSKGADGQTLFGEIGGGKITERMVKMGLTSEDDQRRHMLGHGILRELLAGAGKGLCLVVSKLGKHIDENQALAGIVNAKIKGKEYKEMSNIIDDLMSFSDSQLKESLQDTKYADSPTEVRRALARLRKDFIKMRKEYIPKKGQGNSNTGTSPEEQNAAEPDDAK